MHLARLRCLLQTRRELSVSWLFTSNAAGAEAGVGGRLAWARAIEVGLVAAATRERGSGGSRSAGGEEGRIGAGRRGGG